MNSFELWELQWFIGITSKLVELLLKTALFSTVLPLGQSEEKTKKNLQTNQQTSNQWTHAMVVIMNKWIWVIKRVISNYVRLQSEPCRSNWTHIAFAIHLYFFVFLTLLLSYCDLFCMLLLIAAVGCVYACMCACLCDRMTGILQSSYHFLLLKVFNFHSITCNLSENHAKCYLMKEKKNSNQPRPDTNLSMKEKEMSMRKKHDVVWWRHMDTCMSSSLSSRIALSFFSINPHTNRFG